MPLLFSRHPMPGVTFGAWQAAETEAYFRCDFPLSGRESNEITELQGRRRMEWLAGRWLLHRLSGVEERLALDKDLHSKPYFPDRPNLHCSLSHSQGIIAAMLSDTPCGCDIQVMVGKLARIATKFLHPDEAAFLQTLPTAQYLVVLHLIWSVKESLYKAYGLKQLEFKEHIRMDTFDWNGWEGTTVGYVTKGAFHQRYAVCFAYHPAEDCAPFVWATAAAL
jgi:4'-phosphopantetheinyl transferase